MIEKYCLAVWSGLLRFCILSIYSGRGTSQPIDVNKKLQLLGYESIGVQFSSLGVGSSIQEFHALGNILLTFRYWLYGVADACVGCCAFGVLDTLAILCVVGFLDVRLWSTMPRLRVPFVDA